MNNVVLSLYKSLIFGKGKNCIFKAIREPYEKRVKLYLLVNIWAIGSEERATLPPGETFGSVWKRFWWSRLVGCCAVRGRGQGQGAGRPPAPDTIAQPPRSTAPALQSPDLGRRSVRVLDKAHGEGLGMGPGALGLGAPV